MRLGAAAVVHAGSDRPRDGAKAFSTSDCVRTDYSPLAKIEWRDRPALDVLLPWDGASCALAQRSAPTSGFSACIPADARVVRLLVSLNVQKLDLDVGGERVARIFRPGDLTILPSGVPATLTAGACAHHVHYCLSVEVLDHAAGDATQGDRGAGLIARSHVRDPLLAGALSWASQSFAQLPGNPAVWRHSLAIMVAGRLLHSHAGPRPPGPSRHAIAPFRLRRALDFIEAHLAESIRLGDIAAAAGLSPHHFARSFRRAMGAPPYQYVVKRRVDRALDLLVNSDLPLAQVAVECGFSTQQQFTETFHRATGEPPGRYRRAHGA